MEGIRFIHIRGQKLCRNPLLNIVGKVIDSILFQRNEDIFKNINENDAAGDQSQKCFSGIKSEIFINPKQNFIILDRIFVHDDLNERHENRNAHQLQKASDNNDEK